MTRTLEQERASFAMKKVLISLSEEDKGKYATLIRKLPAMVIHNGLGQSMAYLLADDEGKKQRPSWKLYESLQEWLCNRRNIYQGTDLIESLMEGERKNYLYAQQEALSLLAWMTKFADAYLPKERG